MNNSRRHHPRARPIARLDEAWLRFLLIEGITDADINDALAADDLPPATAAELRTFRHALDLPTNFSPTDGAHLATTSYLRKHHIALFYEANGEAAAAALRVLRERRVREVIEAAIIVGVPTQHVVSALDKYLGFRTGIASIDDYERVFFNVQGLARAQLQAAVERRVRLAVARVVGDDDERAVRRAVLADARVVATRLPKTRLTWAAVFTALGWQPMAQNVSTTLQDIANLALVRAGEALARGGDDDDRRVGGYVGVLERLHALREQMTDPNETLMQAFGKLRLVQDTDHVPTVTSLLDRGDCIGTLEEGPATADAESNAEHK